MIKYNTYKTPLGDITATGRVIEQDKLRYKLTGYDVNGKEYKTGALRNVLKQEAETFKDALEVKDLTTKETLFKIILKDTEFYVQSMGNLTRIEDTDKILAKIVHGFIKEWELHNKPVTIEGYDITRELNVIRKVAKTVNIETTDSTKAYETLKGVSKAIGYIEKTINTKIYKRFDSVHILKEIEFNTLGRFHLGDIHLRATEIERNAMLVFIHEYGHFVMHELIHNRTHGEHNEALIKGLTTELRKTETCKRLIRIYSSNGKLNGLDKTGKYYLSHDELFARFFTAMVGHSHNLYREGEWRDDFSKEEVNEVKDRLRNIQV